MTVPLRNVFRGPDGTETQGHVAQSGQSVGLLSASRSRRGKTSDGRGFESHRARYPRAKRAVAAHGFELVGAELPTDEDSDVTEVPVRFQPGTEVEYLQDAAEGPERSVGNYLDGGPEAWSLDSVGVVDEDGKTWCDVENVGMEYVEIDGADYLDPPSIQFQSSLKKRLSKSSLCSFGNGV